MEGQHEDVRLGANKYIERQPIGTTTQSQDTKDYKEPLATPLFEHRVVKSSSKCSTARIQSIAWAFGGVIFALVYYASGISGGHINPTLTFDLLINEEVVRSNLLHDNAMSWSNM